MWSMHSIFLNSMVLIRQVGVTTGAAALKTPLKNLFWTKQPVVPVEPGCGYIQPP